MTTNPTTTIANHIEGIKLFQDVWGIEHDDWECFCDPAYGACPTGMCENPQVALTRLP